MFEPKKMHDEYVFRFESAVLEYVLSNGIYLEKERVNDMNSAVITRLFARSMYDSSWADGVKSCDGDSLLLHADQKSIDVLARLGFESTARGYVLRPELSRIVIVPTKAPYHFPKIWTAVNSEFPQIVPRPFLGPDHKRDLFLLKTLQERDCFTDVLSKSCIEYSVGHDGAGDECAMSFNVMRKL